MNQLMNKIKFHLMRKLKATVLDESLRKRTISKIGKKLIPQNIGKSVSIDSKELNQRGFTDLGLFLNEIEIEKIKTEIEPFKCFDPFRKGLGDFKLSDIPEQVHVANYRRQDLVSIKEILDIANNSNILDAVQDFLGAAPTISNINMWWSLSGKQEAEQAQLFHRDVDDLKFCKLFIYLTDVKAENGPHVYVEGSSNSKKLTKIRRYTDSEIFDAFGEDRVKIF